MKGLIQGFGQGQEHQGGIELLTVTNNNGELLPPLDWNGWRRETVRAIAKGVELPRRSWGDRKQPEKEHPTAILAHSDLLLLPPNGQIPLEAREWHSP